MNIICNNCGGADFYHMSKCEYTNPFIWCLIFPEDMYALIENYDKIDFTEFDIKKLSADLAKSENWGEFNEHNRILGLRIDDCFDVYYTHYAFDAKCVTPERRGPNLFYCKNFEYVVDKYEERLKKLNSTEVPCFLIIAYKRHGWTEEKLNHLIKLDTKYKICIITDKRIQSDSDNIRIFYEPTLEVNMSLPIHCVKKHFTDIRKFYEV